MRRTPVLPTLLTVLALLAAACGSPGEDTQDQGLPEENDAAAPNLVPPEGEEDVQPGAPVGESVTCENPQGGYRLAYPESYHAAESDAVAPCSVFDDAPIEITEETAFDEEMVAVVRVEPMDLRTAVESGTDLEILSDVPARVAGRDGHRIHARATGASSLPEGTVMYFYAVPLGAQRTLIASTTDIGEPVFATKKRVLDGMMRGLELLEDDTSQSPSPSPQE